MGCWEEWETPSSCKSSVCFAEARLRILTINVLFPPIQVGGAEKAAKLLVDAFARSGDQVAVISLHPEGSEVVEENDGVRVYRLPMDNLYWPFSKNPKRGRAEKWRWHLRDIWNRKAAKRVGRILDIERPDVVHTHNLSGFSVSIWKEIKKRNIRLVHTLHDYYMLCPRSNLFRDGKSCNQRCLSCQVLTAVSKSCSRLPDAVVSVSESVLVTHRSYGYFRKVPGSVIHNIERSLERSGSSPGLGHKADDNLVFGYIGKVSHAKGIAMLLEATRYLSRDDWRLRIAGTGTDEIVGDLKRRFPDPRIEWLGFTDSDAFYASIDVTVVPSIWRDPLPYVVIESFAAGKAVICSSSGGLPELASLGKRVQTYPATDLPALVEALEQALSDRDMWRTGGFKTPASRTSFFEATVTGRYRDMYSKAEQMHEQKVTPAGTIL
jgi:glycosyltransferase involved in cell wall biosynthesis